MTDQIKPEVDDGRTLSLLARIDELKAQLAAQEQSHKDMLQTVGEEATRQIAEKDKEINRYNAALRTAVSDKVLAEQALAEKDKRIAELDKAVETLGWQCDTHRGRIAELEAALSGGTM